MADEANQPAGGEMPVNPVPPTPPAPSATPGGPKCPYCLATIAAGEATETCPGCRAVYHHECWTENGGCAVYGCKHVPTVESRSAIEVPVSYWGQENKPCPSCGKDILAAAVRCRHCGATFASARPQGVSEFQSRTALEARLPEVRKLAVVIFVLSVLPCTAPIGGVWGWIWSRANREEIAALPALYGALLKIGLIVAAATTTVLVLALTYNALSG